MLHDIPQPLSLKLSICISTVDRATLIGETLESIIAQTTEHCEIVVLDAASTDDTERVVMKYAQRVDCLRYIRQERNNGIDRDFDRAVELARGEYCWLMPDDDLLKPGAVATVLEALSRDYGLVIVNAEQRNVSMSDVLMDSYLDFTTDRVYGSADADHLFEASWFLLTYTGSVVIRREIWLARNRARYYESWFIHVGVIFQERIPGNTLVIANPLISIRVGNQSWIGKWFEIWRLKWPSVISSLPVSESAKRNARADEAWRTFRGLLAVRAYRWYSWTEYRQHIRPRLRSHMAAVSPILVAMLPVPLARKILAFRNWLVPGDQLAALVKRILAGR